MNYKATKEIMIRLYEDKDRGPWDAYVLMHRQGTLFHQISWKQVIENTFGHRSYYLLAESDAAGEQRTRTICGILPLFVIKSFLFSKALVSVPFGAYGGILSENKEAADGMLRKAKDIAQSEGLDYLELRNRDDTMEDLSVKDLYVRFHREIYQELKDNLEAIPRKSRRMVRLGEKEGLTCQFGRQELIPSFYEIFARRYHQLGSPVFPRRLFEHFLEEFENHSNILLVKTRDGIPIAGVLTFYYKDEVLPYYAGSLFEYRNIAPNDYMYWQLMKYGWERGYKRFDFGRSKVNTGSYDFKRHWGFEPEPLPYQFFLFGLQEIPNISPANPKYRKRIELWRRMPLWATRIIGPRIVKYIP